MQSGGGGSSSVKAGRTILIAGLAFQVISFGIFMFIALAFDVKTRRSLGDKMITIRPLIWAFYVSATLIIVRSIFRTIGEFRPLYCLEKRKTHFAYRVLDHQFRL